MSSLEVLSMLGNKLEDKIFFKEGYSFGYLPNLTTLELDRNKFTKLPILELVEHKKLKQLNVGHNQLTKYSPELTELVKKGLDVEYQGKLLKMFKDFENLGNVLQRNITKMCNATSVSFR